MYYTSNESKHCFSLLVYLVLRMNMKVQKNIRKLIFLTFIFQSSVIIFVTQHTEMMLRAKIDH